MSTLRTRFTAPLAIALALVLTPALSGCFSNPVEGIIEGVTGGDVDLGGTSVPDGYPVTEVPQPAGKLRFMSSPFGSRGVGIVKPSWSTTVPSDSSR